MRNAFAVNKVTAKCIFHCQWFISFELTFLLHFESRIKRRSRFSRLFLMFSLSISEPRCNEERIKIKLTKMLFFPLILSACAKFSELLLNERAKFYFFLAKKTETKEKTDWEKTSSKFGCSKRKITFTCKTIIDKFLFKFFLLCFVVFSLDSNQFFSFSLSRSFSLISLLVYVCAFRQLIKVWTRVRAYNRFSSNEKARERWTKVNEIRKLLRGIIFSMFGRTQMNE